MDKIFFLSHVLDEKTPGYGGIAKFALSKTMQMKKGDVCNEMSWILSNHVGTHIDAPRHFIEKGKTVDAFPAQAWLFDRIELVALPGLKPGHMISPKDFGKLKKDTELVLIKTGFERQRRHKSYWYNAPGLHPDLAGWLRKSCPGIRAVGMDLISISNLQQSQLGCAAHCEFLGRGILLAEDMKLSVLKKAPQKVLIAPMRVKDADAAPCSVFAWE